MHHRPNFLFLLFGVCFVIFGSLCLVAFGAKPAQFVILPPNGKYAAKYTVVNANGTPLQKARIYPARFMNEGLPSGGGSRWVNPPLLADTAGRFTLTDASIEQIIVLPAASKREPKPTPFFAPVGKNAPVRIVRPASVPLRVRFVDGDNKPLAQKVVMVFPVAATGRDADEIPTSAFIVDGGFPGTTPELATALTAKTNPNGEAFFPALPKNARVSLTIDAQPDARRPLCLGGSILLRAPSPINAAPLTIRLPFDGEITGQVLQKSTNKPIAGARVHLQEPGPTGGVRAFGPQTDAEGRFHFTGLYPATYRLEFDGLGIDPTDREKTPRYLQTAPAEATLTVANTMRAAKNVLLAQAAQVNVTVRDAKGRPLFAQEVTLNNARGGGGGYTDLNGKITLRDLPGPYNIVWSNSDDHRAVRTIAEKPITLDEGETKTVTLGTAPKADANAAPLRPFAPDFVARDASGKAVRLSQFKGKIVVLDFVYLDAPAEPSDSNLGALRAAQKAARALKPIENERVTFLAVCSGWNGAEKRGWLNRALGKRKQAFPHVLFLQEAWGDPRLPAKLPSATAAFHMDGWPQRFVIGPDGTLRNAYGSSDYGGHGFDEAGINNPARLLRDIRTALQTKSN